VKEDWNKLTVLAREEVEAILADLPKPLGEHVRMLTVTFESKPNRGLQDDGIQVDTLGLFVGNDFAEIGVEVMPSQIILFLENIWDFAEGDEKVFCREVRTTFLHELGHFFGFDENDLIERGLE